MKPPNYARPALRAMGLAIVAGSMLPLFGHMFDIPLLYTSPGGVGMALMTAICLFMVGLGFIMISRRDY